MIFISFQEPDELWKSKVVTIPAHYNLDQCVLSAAGGRGKAVFLHDTTSGMATMFLVNDNREVTQFMEVNGEFELR
jgi:Neuraminidase (sialidase)